MAEYTNVRIAIEDRVAILTIDHPPANAFNRATLLDLNAAMSELIANDQVKVIILTGAGEFAFVAGADINEIGAVKDADEALEFIKLGQNIFNKIEGQPQAGHRGHQCGGTGGRPGIGDGLPHPHRVGSRGSASRRATWASSRAGAAPNACRGSSAPPKPSS